MTQATAPAELLHRPFTLAQARRAGLSARQLQGGQWLRVGPQIYIWAGLRVHPEVQLQAVLPRLPDSAVFSGRTAAFLHGLDVPLCEPIEVTVPPSAGVSIRSGISVSRAALTPEETVCRRRLRVTSPVRTVATLARRPPLVEATVMVDMALHAGLTTVAEVHRWADPRPGGRGMAQLRRVLNLAEPAAESPMETRLRLVLVLAGLPRPQAQVNLFEGGRFLGRADLYYPGARLAIEYDGAIHRHRLETDNRRQNLLLNAGYRLLRFTAGDVLQTPDATVAQVRAALTPSPRASASPHT